MSRSYRKNPICKQKNYSFNKKLANRRVRYSEDVPNGKAYKKYYCSYDICDWKWVPEAKHYFLDDETNYCRHWGLTEKELGNTWEKFFRRK